MAQNTEDLQYRLSQFEDKNFNYSKKSGRGRAWIWNSIDFKTRKRIS